MNPGLIVLIVVAAVAVIAIIYFWQRRRSERLRAHFGSEYERIVEATGDKRRAERELENREKRVEKLNIRDLSTEERERYAEQWRQVQSRFVDEPGGAVSQADELVRNVMETRGYPVGNFDQRVADISVNYPRVVQNYRAAREIAERNREGKASTEDLRQALVYYRALFEELLGVAPQAAKEETEPEKEVVR